MITVAGAIITTTGATITTAGAITAAGVIITVPHNRCHITVAGATITAASAMVRAGGARTNLQEEAWPQTTELCPVHQFIFPNQV